MRVLFLNHNVVGSGTFLRAFHFARQLATRGHRVTLVTTSRNARLTARTYERDGVEMIEAPDLLSGRARTGWDPYNTWVRGTLVRRTRFDLVHAFDSRPAVVYPALAAVANSNALFIMDWADWWGRGGWIHERSGWLFRSTLGPIETWFEETFRTRAHGTTVVSRALSERALALGIAPDRIHCLPGGCQPAPHESVSRLAARRALGLPDTAPLVLHLGVLTPGDYAFLREAFVSARASNPDALLVLAGRTGMRLPPPRPNSGVLAIGAIDDEALSAWLAAAHVCVVPCRDTIGNRGRWPSKVNDYLAAGRAIVMPSVSDAAELIQRTGAGWTTRPEPQAFAEGIGEALSDERAADAAGARGRAVAEGELAWPRLTDQLLAFYERVGAAR